MGNLIMRELTLQEKKVKESLEENSKRLHSQLLLEESESDIMLKAISSLTDLELECSQYLRLTCDSFEDIRKVCLVRIRMSPGDIEKNFKVKVVNVYGTGMFIPIEGIFLSSETRARTHYDDYCKGKKGARFDVSFLPEEVVRTHEFRLSIPAAGGLFIPKKCSLIDWIDSTKCLKYLDASEGL